MTLDKVLNIGDLFTVIVSLLAFGGAVYIGVQQNRINKKLLALQDAVDVYLEIGTLRAKFREAEIDAPVIKIHNVSALPIALHGYNFNGVDRKISPYRLPPASQFPNAYYYIYLPVDDADYASFSLEFEDSFKRKWTVKGFVEVRNGNWEVSSNIPEMNVGKTAR